MECLKRSLEEKFRSLCTPAARDSDLCLAGITRATAGDGVDLVEFSFKTLVAEAVHVVCVELYKIGDLVV